MLIAAESYRFFTTFISVLIAAELYIKLITRLIGRRAENESLSGERMRGFGESRGKESMCVSRSISGCYLFAETPQIRWPIYADVIRATI